MSWHSTESVDEFLDAAGDFLRAQPVENTLLLTIARTVQLRGSHAYGPNAPIFGWLTTGDGAFLQTPPHPLLLSAAPAGRVPELAELLVKRPLPGVNGLTADAEAFAARWRELTGAVRVAPVFTPPELRGRGYGAAVTAAVTQAALDAGADDVVLFTDVANPTSNALYERLGYRPIQDRSVVEFKA